MRTAPNHVAIKVSVREDQYVLLQHTAAASKANVSAIVRAILDRHPRRPAPNMIELPEWPWR